MVKKIDFKQIDFKQIDFDFSHKIKYQFIINTALLIANAVVSMLALLIMFSCEPAVDPTRQFVIRKGDHYASPSLSETLQSQKLVFDARFNESAIYDFNDLSIQSDKNKLMGFCDCNSLPHENSARFAWQWFNNRLEIYGYCYVNGDRQEQFIGVVQLNQYNHFELEPKGNEYIFKLNNQPPVSMKRGGTCTTGFYFKLWPYFGGHVAAPHDVTIDIRPVY
jgi:hypothetical protein